LASGALLDEAITADPLDALGAEVSGRFDGRLPFLLKVLAAAKPLSIQAHPSLTEAIAGFERENNAGIAIDAPQRSFRDANHKPELICALTPFVALCGFRTVEATKRFVAGLGIAALDGLLAAQSDAEQDSDILARALEHLLTVDGEAAQELALAVASACASDRGSPEFAEERRWIAKVAESFPGDRGVAVALLLNLIVLQPGQALFLGAGNLHAYIEGTGVEIMANSDNVLRGGLTPKHIDIPMLLTAVDATPFDLSAGVQTPELVGGIARYDCPVPDFNLDRIEADAANGVDKVVITGSRAQILLCTQGNVTVNASEPGGALTALTLDCGEAAWIPAATTTVEIAGRGTVFNAYADG